VTGVATDAGIPAGAIPDSGRPPHEEAASYRPRWGAAGRYLAAGGLYLLASFGLWWHVWSAGPSSVMTCDCTDAGRMVWYLQWSSFALSHGHQLLYSNWLFHPVGVNLLTDTSAPAISLLLVPITRLFGPVTAMNVASTLIPALTAFSMFWLLQRWVRWAPAAFVGGLAYGFAALVIVQIAFGWLNLACLALLPLVVACLDELFIRQRARPLRVGAALAVLMTVEFFVSLEMVLVVTVSGAVAAVILVGYAALRHPDELRRRTPYAVSGALTALALGSVLLAYPVWFFLAGPAHLSGMVWSSNHPGDLGNALSNLWSGVGRWGPVDSRQLAAEAANLGGYRGPPLPSPSYLGPGLLVVLVMGTAVWRSDRRLWFFGALGVVSAVLSLRVGGGAWGPWAAVDHLPLLDNVVQSRFDAVFVLCAAIMLAVIVDRSRTGAAGWIGGDRSHWVPMQLSKGRSVRVAGSVFAIVVALVALVPSALALGPNLPLTVQPVTVPRWFETVGEHLTTGQVLATYPFATANSQSPIPWQAIGGMHYRMAGGGGPSGTAARAGTHKTAFQVLDDASVPIVPGPLLTPSNLEAVRAALRAWGVTMAVVPDDTGLPPFQTGRGTSYGVALFTSVLGSAPTRQDGAWVWRHVATAPPPRAVPPAELATCTQSGAQPVGGSSPVASCILNPGPRSTGSAS
jgi:hypothetical protein